MNSKTSVQSAAGAWSTLAGRCLITAIGAAGALVACALTAPAALAEQPSDYYTLRDDGTLERPKGYREWVFVGTPVTPNDMNDGKAPFPEFHAVYIDPASWKQWKQSGEFPDGAILMKELISVGSKAAVSGNGYFMGDYLGLEATIKSKKYFPNEPGNWAYYSFSTKDHKSVKATGKPFPAAACNACHKASAATDWVFTQYYPVLNSGKRAGVAATGGHRSQLPRPMAMQGN